MIRANRMYGSFIGHDQVVVDRKKLVELERKARAHDAYLVATRAMRTQADRIGQQERGPREAGYMDCLRDFSHAVLDAIRREPAA